MMGTSLHTLVQMVDNGLGISFIPELAIRAGVLDGTRVAVRTLHSDAAVRQIALVWRRSSPRRDEFVILADALRRICSDRTAARRAAEPALAV